MKYYFCVPSTLNTFIGRGYCKGGRKRRGCVVSVGYGGELEIEPVSEEAVEEVIPEKRPKQKRRRKNLYP